MTFRLQGYATQGDINAALVNYSTTSDVGLMLNNYATLNMLAALQGEIPTQITDYVTSAQLTALNDSVDAKIAGYTYSKAESNQTFFTAAQLAAQLASYQTLSNFQTDITLLLTGYTTTASSAAERVRVDGLFTNVYTKDETDSRIVNG